MASKQCANCGASLPVGAGQSKHSCTGMGQDKKERPKPGAKPRTMKVVPDNDGDYQKVGAGGDIKTTGSFKGKSNAKGMGGRAAQLKAEHVPGGVIGDLARASGTAPGQKFFHNPSGAKTTGAGQSSGGKTGFKKAGGLKGTKKGIAD